MGREGGELSDTRRRKMQLSPLKKEKVEGQGTRIRCNRKGSQRDKIMLQFVMPTTQCTIVVQKLPHFARGLGRGEEEEFFYHLLFIEKGRKANVLAPHDLVKKCLLLSILTSLISLGEKKNPSFYSHPK